MQNLIGMNCSSNWHEIIDEFSKMKANRNIWSIMRRLVLGATVYYVWQERNLRIFMNCERTVDVLVQTIMENIKWRIMSFIVKETVNVKEVEAKWKVQFKRIKRNEDS